MSHMHDISLATTYRSQPLSNVVIGWWWSDIEVFFCGVVVVLCLVAGWCFNVFCSAVFYCKVILWDVLCGSVCFF